MKEIGLSICIYIHIYLSIYVCTHAFIYISIYVLRVLDGRVAQPDALHAALQNGGWNFFSCIHIHIYLSIYLRMHACMYVCISIYISPASTRWWRHPAECTPRRPAKRRVGVKPGGGNVTQPGVEPTSSGCMTGDCTTDLKRSAVISGTGIHCLLYRDICVAATDHNSRVINMYSYPSLSLSLCTYLYIYISPASTRWSRRPVECTPRRPEKIKGRVINLNLYSYLYLFIYLCIYVCMCLYINISLASTP